MDVQLKPTDLNRRLSTNWFAQAHSYKIVPNGDTWQWHINQQTVFDGITRLITQRFQAPSTEQEVVNPDLNVVR